MNIATIYRSPNSSQENNTQMCSLINDICKKQGNTLILGDFNLPHIDWKTWNTTGPLEYTLWIPCEKISYINILTLRRVQEERPSPIC